jgi:hypothetical protein
MEPAPDIRLQSSSPGAIAARFGEIPTGDTPITGGKTAFFERAPDIVASGEALPAKPILIVGTEEGVRSLLERNELPRASLPAQSSASGRRGGSIGSRTSSSRPRTRRSFRSITGPLPHYGSQSYIVFQGRSAVERGVWPVTDSPLQVALGDL